MIVRSSGGVGKREGRRSSIANRRDTHENRSDAHHYGGASGSPQNRHYPTSERKLSGLSHVTYSMGPLGSQGVGSGGKGPEAAPYRCAFVHQSIDERLQTVSLSLRSVRAERVGPGSRIGRRARL